MITGKLVRRLRWRTHRPDGAFDAALAAAAQHAADDCRPYYDAVQNPTTQAIYQYLCRFVDAVAQQQFGRSTDKIRVLDWGGGKGYVTYFLDRAGYDATLFETADFPHQDMWREFKLKTKTAAGGTLPFDDKTFDVVVGFGVLEHVPYDYDALKELNRVLKDDGLLLCFNLPNAYGYLHQVAAWRGVRYHDRLYGSRETRQLLKRAGFNCVGRPWRRQLLPKNSVRYPLPRLWEWIDILLCRTPLQLFATSLEFVARKQYTYTAEH